MIKNNHHLQRTTNHTKNDFKHHTVAAIIESTITCEFSFAFLQDDQMIFDLYLRAMCAWKNGAGHIQWLNPAEVSNITGVMSAQPQRS